MFYNLTVVYIIIGHHLHVKAADSNKNKQQKFHRQTNQSKKHYAFILYYIITTQKRNWGEPTETFFTSSFTTPQLPSTVQLSQDQPE